MISIVTLPVTQLPPLGDPAAWPAGAGPVPAGLEQELAAASAAVRRWCRWHVSPVIEETVTLNGQGGHHLGLPTLRLVELLAIEEMQHGRGQEWLPVDLDPLTTGVEATEAGWLYRDQRWSTRLSGIRVTMRHGFEPAEVPELRSLLPVIVARGLSNPTGVSAATVGALQVQFTRSEVGYTVTGGTLDPFSMAV